MLLNKKIYNLLIILLFIINIYIFYEIFLNDTTNLTNILNNENTSILNETYISEADIVLRDSVPDHYDFSKK